MLLTSFSYMDCGLYLLAYVEYLSEGDDIPIEYFNAELLQIRYGPLLWDYNLKKLRMEPLTTTRPLQKSPGYMLKLIVVKGL